MKPVQLPRRWRSGDGAWGWFHSPHGRRSDLLSNTGELSGLSEEESFLLIKDSTSEDMAQEKGDEISHVESGTQANGSVLKPTLTQEHQDYLMRRHGTTDLHPIPSMDENDPYNWSSTRVSLTWQTAI